MMEYVCDHLCRFPGEISDQEELDRVCDGCQMGQYVCDILNTHDRLSRREKAEAGWKRHLVERFGRVN